jgi:hypothetical protein
LMDAGYMKKIMIVFALQTILVQTVFSDNHLPGGA